MKAALAKKPPIRIAVVESDPLRFVGFLALFEAEPDLELMSASLPEAGTQQNIDLVLLGEHSSQNLFDMMASLRATHPQLRTIVTGSGGSGAHIQRDNPKVNFDLLWAGGTCGGWVVIRCSRP